jgi:hypothetical protein
MKESGDRSMRTINSLTLCRSLLESRARRPVSGGDVPGHHRHQRQGRIYDGYPDVALDMVESRTLADQIQLLEYESKCCGALAAPPERL